MKKPHLEVLETTPEGTPLRGKCSSCAEDFIVGGEPSSLEQKMQSLFDEHFRKVHIREDAAQAAFRIVKEATEEKGR